MKKVRTYLRKHVGRRGLVLAIYSTVFLFVGIKALVEPSVDGGRFLVYTILPPIFRGVLWITPAVIGLASAVKPKHDAFGFGFLTVPPAVLIISYLGSTVAYFLGLTTYHLAWVDAIEWVLILGLLLVTSGWQEDDELPVADTDKEEEA